MVRNIFLWSAVNNIVFHDMRHEKAWETMLYLKKFQTEGFDLKLNNKNVAKILEKAFLYSSVIDDVVFFQSGNVEKESLSSSSSQSWSILIFFSANDKEKKS